jgi:hypothetical protein
MKTGYTVENVHIWNDADYIIIGNYHNSNKVCGFYYYYTVATIKERTSKSHIGVWHIKKKSLKSEQ